MIFVRYLFDLEVAIFRKPVDTICKYVKEKHLVLSSIFIFLFLALFSLFFYLLGSEGLVDFYYWVAGNPGSMARNVQELTFGFVFLSIFLKSGIILFSFTFLLFAFGKIFKEKGIMCKEIINLLGICLLFFSNGLGIALLVFQFLPLLSLFLFWWFLVGFFFCLIIGYERMFRDKNRGMYSFLFSLMFSFFLFSFI